MTDHTTKLIRLVGRDFRSTAVQCPHCAWTGLAGELIVPGTGSLGQGVVYACPGCDTDIARHGGLSLEEIDAELRDIRAELASELPATMNTNGGAANDAAMPDFQAVRAQIKDLV